MDACILGLGLAEPPYRASQEAMAGFLSRVLRASATDDAPDRALAFVDRIFSRSGIRSRYSVLPDYGASDPAAFAFYPPSWDLEPFPTTAQRMAVYEREAVELARRAAVAALAQADVEPARITHLVLATCTGFFAPGPDVALIERLGLDPNVERCVIGFMGCYAGFSALRVARRIARSDAEAHVLVVCVELCTLHFQKRPDADFLVSNALFGDGAAAVVVAARNERGPGRAAIERDRADLDLEGSRDLAWRIGDHGFEMRMSVDLPRRIQARARAFVEALLEGRGACAGEVSSWALHPGGRGIVERVAAALELPDEAVAPSLAVLAERGNVSSPTIFFVLDRVFRQTAAGEPIAALGFGPGLTFEGLLLRRM